MDDENEITTESLPAANKAALELLAKALELLAKWRTEDDSPPGPCEHFYLHRLGAIYPEPVCNWCGVDRPLEHGEQVEAAQAAVLAAAKAWAATDPDGYDIKPLLAAVAELERLEEGGGRMSIEPVTAKTLGECDNCHFQTDELAHYAVMGGSSAATLCKVCSSTYFGRATTFPRLYGENATLFKSLAWSINTIIAEVRKNGTDHE